MSIASLLDRPIAYHRVFVTLTGSVKAAIFLSQAIYWQKRATQKDGWWYKSAEEWQDETGLSKREQDTARRDCEQYLKSDLRGVPATLYWKVDEEELEKSLIQFSGKRETGNAESAKQVSPKPQSKFSQNGETLNRTETTTENTAEEQSAPSASRIPETMKEASEHPDIQTFQRVSGVFPPSKHYQEIVEVMRHLRNKHGERLESYLAPFWSAWGKGKTKDGKPYSKTNPAWFTEWAFQGEIPQTNGHEPQGIFTPIPSVEATRKAIEEKDKLDALVMQQRLAKGMHK